MKRWIGCREIVWRGIGSKRISDETENEKATEAIDEAVSEILKSFPPAPAV